MKVKIGSAWRVDFGHHFVVFLLHTLPGTIKTLMNKSRIYQLSFYNNEEDLVTLDDQNRPFLHEQGIESRWIGESQ